MTTARAVTERAPRQWQYAIGNTENYMTNSNSVDAEIFRRAVCFTMTMRRFSNRRQGDVSKVREASGDSLTVNRFKLSKKLIESPEFDAIVEFQGKLYKWATMRSTPSFFKEGIYLVKNEMVPEFEARLNEAVKELRDVLIPEFVAAYPGQIEEARQALNGQFNIQDYPRVQDVPNRFGIEWNWISFGVPENLPAELRAAEAAKISARFAEAEAQIMEALRSGFAETLAHVSERLTVEPGGKPKVFRDTLFEELTEYIGTFNARNLANDKELGSMVEKAQAILARVNGGDAGEKARNIRDAASMREQTAKAFAEMREAVNGMIGEKPVRKFDFSEA